MSLQLTEHEQQRRKLWCDAWVAVANAYNSRTPEVATGWADAALADFDERFESPFSRLNRLKSERCNCVKPIPSSDGEVVTCGRCGLVMEENE